MAREVVNRYYEPHKVVIDLIASYYLYDQPDLIPSLVEETNQFIGEEPGTFSIEPLTVKQMKAYHCSDTMIWVFFRAVKRLDRWITKRVFRKKYRQRLPSHKFIPGAIHAP